jgi:hypothetical protein
MPYADAMLLWREFEEAPPVRTLFAKFVGYENPHRRWSGKNMSGDDFMFLQKAMGAPAQPKMPDHLKDALNWAENMKKKHPALQ